MGKTMPIGKNISIKDRKKVNMGGRKVAQNKQFWWNDHRDLLQ